MIALCEYKMKENEELVKENEKMKKKLNILQRYFRDTLGYKIKKQKYSKKIEIFKKITKIDYL